jgi:hypothetical protein
MIQIYCINGHTQEVGGATTEGRWSNGRGQIRVEDGSGVGGAIAGERVE